MHRNIFPPARRALAAGALALALAACVDQPGLFDPTTETPVSADAPILRLTADTLALRECDRLSFPVNTRGGKSGQAEIFVVESARNVLWRSGTRPAVRDVASVSFTRLIRTTRAPRVTVAQGDCGRVSQVHVRSMIPNETNSRLSGRDWFRLAVTLR